MKITDLKKGSLGSVGKSKKSGAAQNTESAGGNQPGSVRKAAVSVSSSGDVSASLAQNAMERSEKVAELRMDVESGNFEPDSKQTADRIVDSLADYSLA